MRAMALPVAAMCVIVVASNILVQYPFRPFGLQDYFTWAAFSYPVSFLVTDLTNRRFGVEVARRVVVVGFVLAVGLSMYFASPRIALASGSAFLAAQLLDVTVFDRLRRLAWWRAPLFSSLVGSAVDTAMFFSLAFAAVFSTVGANLPFALEPASPFGGLVGEMPRWVAWAVSDFGVKVFMGLVMLVPYGALRGLVRPIGAVQAG
jgi:uncharacterized PurR-regulated membrane protein YhhQ (DUF165 family)